MIPPHSVPVLQSDGSILRGACWCDPDFHVDEAVDEEGNVYVFPHTVHSWPMQMYVACGRVPPC